MHLDLEAGKQFDVTEDQYVEVFEKRLRSSNEYGPFIAGEFKPYIPSENISEKFATKAEEFRASNRGSSTSIF